MVWDSQQAQCEGAYLRICLILYMIHSPFFVLQKIFPRTRPTPSLTFLFLHCNLYQERSKSDNSGTGAKAGEKRKPITFYSASEGTGAKQGKTGDGDVEFSPQNIV